MTVAASTTDLTTLFPPSIESHHTYEEFLHDDGDDGDDDDEEDFYPPPELDEYYVPEDIVPMPGARVMNAEIVDEKAMDQHMVGIEEDPGTSTYTVAGVKKERKKKTKFVFEIRKPIYS
jgi:hypothetical protein